MKTVNSLSGGKSSSYIALNYKADFNVFSLVRTNDKLCQYPDKKVRQIVSDLIGKRNKWGMVEWRKPSFPLIDNDITQKEVQQYWNKNKSVKFNKGYYNNCVGCFHRNPMFLNKMAQEHRNKMEWFAKMEEENKPNTFIKDVNYKQIINFAPQTEISFDDFNECDSGYCGL